MKQVAFLCCSQCYPSSIPLSITCSLFKVQGAKTKSEIKHWFPRKQQCTLYSEMFGLILLVMKLALNFNK